MLLAGAKGVPVRVSLVSCMTQLERTQRSAQRSAHQLQHLSPFGLFGQRSWPAPALLHQLLKPGLMMFRAPQMLSSRKMLAAAL